MYILSTANTKNMELVENLHVMEVKLNRFDKKIARKQKRSQFIVEKETGVKCCDNPTKHVVICNAGLSNGFSEELLLEHFTKHGPLENVVMPPGKSCCFVSYTATKDAVTAVHAINGKLNLAQDGKPLILGYVQELPILEVGSTERPPGLIVLEDIVTSEEEERLLNSVHFGNADGVMRHRKVVHYGYEFRYDNNNVDKDAPLDRAIPKACDVLWERLEKFGVKFRPDQATVNCYEPGQGIPPHVDTHSAFYDPIVSLSLGSKTVMDFRHNDGRHCRVLLPQRSLTVMSGESRYDWTHGITPRRYDVIGNTVHKRGTRVSFTFRKIRRDACDCNYKNHCDSYVKADELRNDVAAKLERTHVFDVYENIADHFSDTRHKPWPNVHKFVNSFGLGSVLVDVGCGNGKYLGLNDNVYDIGCDTSCSLLNVCRGRGFKVFSCNCLQVSLRDEVADGVISIAVIHHLANQTRRRKALQEIIRILKPGGRALVYVWAKDQTKTQKSSYLLQDRKNRKADLAPTDDSTTKTVDVSEEVSLPVHTNRQQFHHTDLLVPWKLKSENKEFLRFYHVFEEGELEKLCASVSGVEVVESYYDQGNWCVIFKKGS